MAWSESHSHSSHCLKKFSGRGSEKQGKVELRFLQREGTPRNIDSSPHLIFFKDCNCDKNILNMILTILIIFKYSWPLNNTGVRSTDPMQLKIHT